MGAFPFTTIYKKLYHASTIEVQDPKVPYFIVIKQRQLQLVTKVSYLIALNLTHTS